MEQLATALKLLGHPVRLRILALLSRGELTVSELVQILELSQPRITQYMRALHDADIIERFKEGSWVFSRLRTVDPAINAIVKAVLNQLPNSDGILQSDLRRLSEVRAKRARLVDAFFANVAKDGGQLGDEYLPQRDAEAAMRAIIGPSHIDTMIDLGTGTGRMLKIFAEQIGEGFGIDNSPNMLKIARHNLSGQDFAHIRIQQGDLRNTQLNAGSFSLATLHQVLHYLADPAEAVLEAARLLRPGGRLLVTDFAPHNQEEFRERYAHRRLGFGDAELKQWFDAAALRIEAAKTVKSLNGQPNICLWLGQHRD